VSETHGHDVRTEKLDIQPRSVRRAGVWLVAVTIGAMLVLLPLMSLLEDLAAGRDAAPRPVAFDDPRQAPAPRLQRFPTRDVEAMRAEEAQVLGSYAWVDREQGVVRLPIERAMALVVERGLPAPPAAAPAPAPAAPAAPGPGAPGPGASAPAAAAGEVR
jgi:hypothetical protein